MLGGNRLDALRDGHLLVDVVQLEAVQLLRLRIQPLVALGAGHSLLPSGGDLPCTAAGPSTRCRPCKEFVVEERKVD